MEKSKSKRRNGGISTFKKYGSEYMSKLAKKSHKKRIKNKNSF